MRKTLFSLLIVIFLGTALVTKTYFHAGFPYTHDGENHLARFANYYLAVREGQVPPRFAPNLFNHYGYPVFNFNYPLANIFSLPFSILKVPYEYTFKILVVFALMAGGLGVFAWMRRLDFRRRTAILTTAVFYTSIYLVNTIAFRGNIGEIFALCVLPWVFWSIEIARYYNQSWRSATLSVFFLAALFLSHNITAVFAVPLLFSYALARVNRKNTRVWLRLAILFVLSLGVTLWFWLPAVAEKSLTVVDTAGVNTAFLHHFPTFQQLLFSSLQFGFSFPAATDSLSFQIGYVQLAVLLFGVFELGVCVFSWEKMKNAPHKRVFIWALAVCVGLFLFQLSFTAPIWKVVAPLSKYLQFPWRLSLFYAVCVLPLFAYVWERASRFSRWILCILFALQMIVIFRVHAVDYFHRQNIDYDFFTQSTSTLNENRTKDFTYTNIGDWQPTASILSGKGSIEVQSWRGSKRSYTLNLQEPSRITEPTMVFAGWQTRANDRAVTYLQSPEIAGRLAYELPAGTYQIHSSFTQWTWPRMIGNATSISVVVFLLFINAREFLKKKKV